MSLKNSIKYTLASLAAALPLWSCDSFLQEYSQDLSKVESWEDLDELLVGEGYFQSGAFSTEGASSQGENIDFLHFMADEVTMTGGIRNDQSSYHAAMFPFYTWQADTGVDNKFNYRGGDSRTWDLLYQKINVCNAVLGLIDQQPAADPVNDAMQIRRVKGEARFLRAFYYFMLTNLYAEPYAPSTAATTPGVPVKVSENVEDKEFMRETLADTYAMIVEDLTQAIDNLDGITRQSIYFADKRSAEMLLARVYLYMQDHANAALYAGRVLEADDKLMDLHTVNPGEPTLVASNPEIIFSMGSYEITYSFHNGGNYYYDDVPFIEVSQDMIDLYARGDLRGSRYIGKTEFGGYEKAFVKYNGFVANRAQWYETGSVFTLRTSEAYLILAEAQAMLGRDNEAAATLNKFLSRRMTGEYTLPQGGEQLVQFIRDENAREFLVEGHRWFDLRRYTVDAHYPWSKEITHRYPYEDHFRFDRFEWYRLNRNDVAYTLPVPRTILDFQISLGTVVRPARRAYDVTYEMEYGDDDDDWDDDDW